MTVYIEKPAVNLREELASLRNQGGYQEQQFYFDSLVTNGTFDAGISGWTAASNATLAYSSGRLQVTSDSGFTFGVGSTPVNTVIGQKYRLLVDTILGTSTSHQVWIGTSSSGATIYDSGTISTTSTIDVTFTAVGTTTYINLIAVQSGATSLFDNIAVYETDGTDVIHTMPKGWVPKDVYEDGLLQREGSAHDYTVVYDGFDYIIKPAVAPSATTQTCVIGVKA